MRWLFLCRLHGGRATFEQARDEIPIYCDLADDEQILNSSRSEPGWLTDMRNVKRTVGQGKNPFFEEAIGGAMRLSKRGREELDPLISNQQLNQTIRLKEGRKGDVKV